MKKLLIVFSLLPLSLFAQEPCGTDIMYKKALSENPELLNKRQSLTAFTNNFDASKSAGTVKIIPVVFHIIHDYASENISRAQVMDALNIINEDFRKLNADTGQIVTAFQSIAADSEIEFRLANIDPFGNCTDGITRTVSPLTANADENVKALISWPNDKYLNIWVVRHISFGAGGYAYYPGTASPGNEGIVVLHTQTGGIGTSGGSNFARRTLTHEVGHYLNLMHTWGDSNDCGQPDNCWYDDDVTDTPNTSGDCQGCNLTANTCGNGIANTQNYMDYATCTKMFTQGQKVRMHAALNSWIGDRYNLWQPANLIATGTNTTTPSVCVPVSDFKASATMICEGAAIQFTDMSWSGVVDTFSWSFPGGTPSASNLANPLITYNTPGVYPVTLTVSNAAGTDTKIVNSFIHVRPVNATITVPSSEGFENPVFPNGDWLVFNDGGNQWQRTTNASFSGSASVYINNYSGNATETKDIFITGGFDMSNVSNAFLKFKLAYASRTPGSNDILRVFATNSCGQFWTMRYNRVGDQLSTAGVVFGNFIPANQNQWREETINLSSSFFSGNPNVFVKFEYYHDTGNNIYIDDINVDGLVGINDPVSYSSVNLYPNPAVQSTRIEFTLTSAELVTVKLIDLLGREIKTIAQAHLPAGEHYTEIDEIGAPGVYFVKLVIGDMEIINKLIVR